VAGSEECEWLSNSSRECKSQPIFPLCSNTQPTDCTVTQTKGSFDRNSSNRAKTTWPLLASGVCVMPVLLQEWFNGYKSRPVFSLYSNTQPTDCTVTQTRVGLTEIARIGPRPRGHCLQAVYISNLWSFKSDYMGVNRDFFPHIARKKTRIDFTVAQTLGLVCPKKPRSVKQTTNGPKWLAWTQNFNESVRLLKYTAMVLSVCNRTVAQPVV